MILYHGTDAAVIHELRPVSTDREGRKIAYLTDNFAYSLFYLRDREIDFVTCGVDKHGVVRYDEKFPDQLRVIYAGRSGWIYEAEADAQPTKTNGIFVCTQAAPVVRAQYIADAYEAICAEIERGHVVLKRFEDLTAQERALNDMGVRMELARDLSPAKRAFFLKHFPNIEKSSVD